MVRAERHSEHIRAHLAADTLGFQLLGEIEEHLTGNVRKGGARTATRCKLCNEYRRLADDGVDQELDIHDGDSRGTGGG